VKTGIYSGEVIHQRFAPKAHRLRYHIFQVLLDLDDPQATARLFSRNRFNLFSFHDRDHGPDQDSSREASLNVRMRTMLAARGLCQDGDRLFLLAMPRVLGFVFNPISLYFVQRPDGGVRTVVYEVNNTFGDRHSYILPVQDDSPRIRQHSDKRLHVSPFMDMDMAYDFDLKAPDETFVLNIRLTQHGRDMLFAGFTARRQPLSDAVLLRLFAVMPLMTIKVVLGIHWEALLIWLKGIRLRPKPPTPRSSISV
jgi:uncharacterized protein